MQHQNWLLEAAINWRKGTTETNKIKLTTTSGFYSTEIPSIRRNCVYKKIV
jgi:hypothetical protein